MATEPGNEADVPVTIDDPDAHGQMKVSANHNVARMPVARNAEYYNMSFKRRGMAIILNHENFMISNLKQRTGTNVDSERLEKTLSRLGFQVVVHKDLSVRQVFDVVEKAASAKHSDCDCFLMAVLTHGEMGILYAKDTPYKPESLWSPFTADKCPTLAGKPKLFFIQACQGDRLDAGITLRTEVDGEAMNYKIPTHADFLIAYSTVPGFYSWRNTTNGSWFMQALCIELEARGTSDDLLRLLTFVNQRVAINFESNTPNDWKMHRQKQIPCVTTMLTRLLLFTPKSVT